MSRGENILRGRHCRWILLSVAMLLVSMAVNADIYKYRGVDGHILFSDRPMKGNYRLLWKSISKKPAKKASSKFAANLSKNRQKLTPLIDATAKQLRLHPGLLHAIVDVESSYNPKAVSSKGAKGLMQLMPATANHYGVSDSFDPKENLKGGARYLKHLLKRFEFNLGLALAAYNAGEGTVKKYGNRIPPFPETQQYVEKVLGVYRKNRQAMLN